MRKKFVWAVLLAVSITLPLCAQVQQNVVVMTVNDQPVYSWELGLMIPQVQQELLGQGTQPTRDQILGTVMQRILDARLLAQEARRRGVESDSAKVAAELAQIEERAGGRAGLETVLARLGATYGQLLDSVTETDLVERFIETQINSQISIKAEDVEAFYNANPEMFLRPDMVRARHILIRLTPNSTTADKKTARARAQVARERVVAGEDFALVAGEVSEGREAAQGGDMGFFAQDAVMPELANPAFALDVGEISDIIETQFGFHILKLVEKREASQMPFSEAKAPVEQLLRENQAGEKVSELLLELKESADVVMMEAPKAAPAGPDGG
jgi:peptidyl-prolyl cis-trans isomerase C